MHDIPKIKTKPATNKYREGHGKIKWDKTIKYAKVKGKKNAATSDT